ncbi:MAG: MFS transporter [Sphingomonas sp.]
MFNWFESLNRTERRAFYACFGGWAVDALDAQIYSFLIPTLIAAWSMTTAEAGLLGTSALISSAFGGWIAGMLCDRLGRVRVMALAIAWFLFFTVLCGFADSFEQLMAARILAGLGFGGEWAAGAVLIGEIIRPEYRGKAVGSVQSAYAIGYAVAAIMSSVLFGSLAPELAWRWMFWLGVAPAILVFAALRNLEEPAVFLAGRQARAARGAEHVNPLMIFHPRLLRITILTGLLALGVQAGAFSMQLWLPTLLRTAHGLSTVQVGYHMFTMTAGSFVGYLVAAYLCDAIGRRRNFLLFVLLNWMAIPAFLYLSTGTPGLFVLDFALGFASLGIYSALGPYFTELFPGAIRASGQGFSYNFGRGVGAFFPAIVGLLSTAGGLLQLRDAMALVACFAYLFVVLAIALLPETRGRDLAAAPDLI